MDNEAKNDNKSMIMSNLISILAEGEDEARRLSLHANQQLQNAAMHFQSKFSKAIAIVNSMEDTNMRQMPSHSHKAASGSPGRSGSGSPSSEGSERMNKKSFRKGNIKRTVKVPFTAPNTGPSDTALAPDDGFSWRKYGQKNILNAKFPRSYYRCTFQKSQNCPAVKHVQRSDEDPTFLDVTYQGDHACGQYAGQSSLTQSLENQLLIPTQNESNEQFMIDFNNPYPTIETHESCQDEQGNILSPSSISSAHAGLRSENRNVFSPSSTSLEGAFSSGFVSSSASDSNYFSVFQSEFCSDFGGISSFHGSEFQLNDVIPMPCSDTSATHGFTTEQPTYPFNSTHPFK